MKSNPPDRAYGILEHDPSEGPIGAAAAQIRRLGFAIVDSTMSCDDAARFAKIFDATRERYVARFGAERLRACDEHNTIRMPMAVDRDPFLALATDPNVLAVLGQLIRGQVTLNQQNGIINPAGETYNQGAWHRDLPYQHYVSSTPLAINALYCVDDFTFENGSTWVLPASHKETSFPSEAYIGQQALQVTARAGQFIVLDCMLYHSGGANRSSADRRAVNHVYTIPYFKPQIRIPGNVAEDGLTRDQRRLLGFDFDTPASVSDYIDGRPKT